MPQPELLFDGRAGGAMLTKTFVVSVTHPHLHVVATATGLEVTMYSGNLYWATEWAQVIRILATKRKIALYCQHGQGARIVFLRRRTQQRLLAVIEAQGIPVQKTRMIVTAPF